VIVQHLRHLGVIGIFALGLAACSGFNAASVPPSAAIGDAATGGGRQYLYVARPTLEHRGLIERYLLHDGIPQKRPGFTIRIGTSYADQIAVTGDGTIFALNLDSNNNGPVVAYAPGRHVVERTIRLPEPRACFHDPSSVIYASTIATDRQGFLFVAFATFAGGNTPRRTAVNEPANAVCAGIWVFSPGADGKAIPVVTIPLPRDTVVTTMSVDPSDNLYADITQTHVVEFANATTLPVRTRVFHGPDRHMQSVTTDELGNVFIGTTKDDYTVGHVNRFTAEDQPRDGPVNSIVLGGPDAHFVSSLAALSRHVFVADGYNIGVYHAFESGPQNPIVTVNGRDIESIAIGP
jgi:hypothetical protein